MPHIHKQVKFAGTQCRPIVRRHPSEDICCSPTLLLTCVRAPLYVYFTIHTCIYDPLYVPTYKPRVVVPSPLLPLVYPIVSMCSIWLISLEPLLFYNLSWSLGCFQLIVYLVRGPSFFSSFFPIRYLYLYSCMMLRTSS